MQKLPSLDHLRAFEAAARHLSFKEAAKELNVTAAAVGQRIRSLEGQIGKDLFVRKTRQIHLTSDGQTLVAAVSRGLDAIHSGLHQLSRAKQDNVLTVSSTASFIEMCLLPHLAEFTKSNPECDIRLVTTNKRVDLGAENVDVAIRYGRGGYDGYEFQTFANDVYIPVCSSEFLKSAGPIESPSDVLNHPLIETNWRVEPDAAPTWDDWFQQNDMVASRRVKRVSVSLDAHTVRAALEGQGIALCHQLFADSALTSGRLVRLFDCSRDLQPQFSHYLVWRKQADTRFARQFRDWIAEKFGTVKR